MFKQPEHMYQNKLCLFFGDFPLATNLEFNLRIDLSKFFFILNIHLHLMGLHPDGRSTNFHVPLSTIEVISSSVASFQKEAFGNDIVCSYINGSDSTLKRYGTQLEIEYLDPSTS